ncbi:MAG: peptidyl-prolyl cis-trans isomerase [Candidatus Omnitrophica bacterium]|nr:peptidyl-prolyl cis-trans isomerase [Candidatus Omnitrophota bacterium]
MFNIRSCAKFLIIACLLLASSIFCLSQEIDGDKIVAVVNDMIVTQSEVQDFINFSYIQLSSRFSGEELEKELSYIADKALLKIIEDKLILQEAVKEKIEVSERVIENRLEDIKSTFPTEADFQSSLFSQNLSLSDIKKHFREQELMRAIVDRKIRSKIQVSPSEITDFYMQYPEKLAILQGLEVSFVFFLDKSEAERSLQKIKNGKNFNLLFSGHENYQALFEIRKGMLDAKVEANVFKLSPGEISDVIELNNRFYIFKILKFLPPKDLTLPEAQDSIYKIIFNEKFNLEFMSWLDKLKNEAYIVIK